MKKSGAKNTAEWAAIPAADGPSSWQHITAQVDSSRVTTNRVAVLKPTDVIKPVKLDPVVVSNVVMGNETVNFDVDKVGVPVLVKVSYFPNWEVSGAQGPYRVAPNLMVVVPTSKHVRLNFARSYTDYLAYGLTLLGIVLLFVLRKYVHINYRKEELVAVVEPEQSAPSSVDLDYVDEAALRR